MTERPSASRRNQDLKSPRDRSRTYHCDDLVRVLVKLTDDVERFDSTILLKRQIIEDRARHLSDVDDEEVSREAQAIRAEVAELVVRARMALDELRRLGEQTSPSTPGAAGCDLSRALLGSRRGG